MMQELPLSKVYQLLEPGPVVFLTTAAGDSVNVMTMSWHMMMEFEPPLVSCVVSANGHSFSALRSSGECVIAIPGVELAETVVNVGNSSGRNIDKFKTFGLTPLPAQKVAAPLVAECFANLECRVVDDCLIDRYNAFILEVVQAWIDPGREQSKTIHHRGYGTFAVDGDTIVLPSKMP